MSRGQACGSFSFTLLPSWLTQACAPSPARLVGPSSVTGLTPPGVFTAGREASYLGNHSFVPALPLPHEGTHHGGQHSLLLGLMDKKQRYVPPGAELLGKVPGKPTLSIHQGISHHPFHASSFPQPCLQIGWYFGAARAKGIPRLPCCKDVCGRI